MARVKLPRLFCIMDLFLLMLVSYWGKAMEGLTDMLFGTSAHAENAYVDDLIWRGQQDYLDKMNDENADEAYRKQIDFYTNYQSPNAMYNQYKQLGASDQAALMSALGQSPNSSSAPTAGSNAAPGVSAPGMSGFGDAASIMNALQNSLNSSFNAVKTSAEVDQIRNDIKWQDTLNGKQVDKMLFDMDMDLKRYGLDKDIYDNVTKPTAKSLIDLNSQEIKNKQAQWNNLCQEYYNLKAQYHKTLAETRNLDANTEYVSGSLTDKTVAETGLVQQQNETEKSETLIKQYEGQIKGLEARVSSLIGVPIHLPMPNIMYGKTKMNNSDAANYVSGQVSDFRKGLRDTSDAAFVNIKKGIDVAFKKGLSTLQNSENMRMLRAKYAKKYAQKFADDYMRDNTYYRRNRDRLWEKY